ncbi:transglutaminase-like protein [Gleimia coleocanis DSM 15436]|uniref:Transglutaminase-like protein n=1 Tax=Gleimia coleocanis DSM 15436 TaxID=525245 RepID=C0W0X8_9ACTO|nr:transglutaminase domain-containing protein [Gleimia coleocanis]EEH63702.1 transglutaminase-like protein [Gleimia coleocanis DSM 15436]
MRKLVSFITAGMLAFTLSGCFPGGTVGVRGDRIKTISSITELKKKYDEEANITFEEIHEISSDDVIQFEVKEEKASQFDYWEDFEIPNGENRSYYHPVEVYTDIALTSKPFLEINRDFQTNTISISSNDERPIYAESKEKFGSLQKSPYKLYTTKSWGLLDRIYVVVKNDFKTGKLLEKPKIITYKINSADKNAPSTPVVSHNFTENGSLELKWESVEGATEYLIVKVGIEVVDYKDKALDLKSYDHGISRVIAHTNKTSWNINAEKQSREWIISELQNQANPIEDELFKQLGRKPTEEEFQVARKENTKDVSSLAVVALKGQTPSVLSNRVALSEYEDRVSLKLAAAELEANFSSANRGLLTFANLEDMPTKLPVTMVSGRTRDLPVKPLWDKAEKEKQGLKVPMQVLGAGIIADFTVEKYPENYREILKKLSEDAEKIPTGVIETKRETVEEDEADKIKQKQEEKPVSKEEAEAEEKLNEEQEIFASNALSAHIARHLLHGEEYIDTSQFPEARNTDYLLAALYEAATQTTNAPQISRYRYTPSGTSLIIEYVVIDKATRNQRTMKARNALRSAVKEMRLDNLSDLEKTRKINRWVIDNTKYNYAALRVLRENNSKGVPINEPELETNWTTYGTAVVHKGVCESYAESFVFMAREAGMEAVVVTGGIHGDPSIGHAWAAVKIDGKWLYYDPTWNDIPGDEELYFAKDINDPVMTDDHAIANDYIMPTYINNYR